MCVWMCTLCADLNIYMQCNRNTKSILQKKFMLFDHLKHTERVSMCGFDVCVCV